MKELRAIISGKVQGVFFRAWTRETAQSLSLSGWVRNLPDGTVETQAQGDEKTLTQFRKALEQGAPLSRVSSVQHEILDAKESLSGFIIQR